MSEITTNDIKDYLQKLEGREITLTQLRSEFNILPGSKSFDAVRNIMFQLGKQKIVKPTGRKAGNYKVITKVQPVQIFGIKRERRLPFDLIFPKDFDTGMEMEFAEHIVIREHDLITIGGQSNWGKTTLALNFGGENIHHRPVLMGNEYTTKVGETVQFEPTPRLLNRLDAMTWIQWTDEQGFDKFTLLPVRDDYAEHIVKDKINIIDWINLDADRLYDISKIMDDIKAELGRGIGIIVLQKAEGTTAPRGGQFAKDFTDCELLIDKLSDRESLLTIGKVKEYTKPVIGKTYAFSISQGVKIINFREVKKCPDCRGQGYKAGKPCETCNTKKFVDA